MKITRRIYTWICLVVTCATLVQALVAHVSFFNAEKQERERFLFQTVADLDRHIPADFMAMLSEMDAIHLPIEEQVILANQELQPVIEMVSGNDPAIGLGVYSLKLDRVVAVVPFAPQLLGSIPEELPYFDCYETLEPDVIQVPSSFCWDGKAILAVTCPIKRDGEIIGHAWASFKMNDVYAATWANAARTVLTGLTLLVVILLATCWFFSYFQQELQRFAAAVVRCDDALPDSLLPELEPLLSAIRERTRRLEKEIAAKNRTQRELNSFFDASPDLLTVSSIHGGLQRVNQAVKRVLGFEPDEYVRMPMIERIHPEDFETTKERVDGISQTQDVTRFETRYLCRDGSYKWIAWSAVPLLNEGLIIAVGRDMTTQKQWEKDMLRLDRLNLAAQMAASISHEIRNPMTTVRGYLQLFGRKEEYRDYRDHFQLMIEELDRANAIISEFLSVARNRAADLKQQDLNSLIRALHPLLQADAILANAEITLQLSPVPSVLLDEKEIRQLLLNLVRNGVEAMPDGGTVTITTREQDGRVIMEIRDQGTGIPREILDRIGSPFFSTKENGTGLGLAVCYRIVEEHRAEIDFDSDGNGTTFRVCFPPEPVSSRD